MPSILSPNLLFHESCANKLCTMSWHIFLRTMSRHLSTMRYVHPAEEQKRFAAAKFEKFRVAGMVEAMEKSRHAATISATVQ
jgi:hypothetical protein